MPRFAIVDPKTKRIVNVAIYDKHPGDPPPGYPSCVAIEHERVGPDWIWDGSTFQQPPSPPPPSQPRLARSSLVDDPDFRALLKAIGVDPAVIVAARK